MCKTFGRKTLVRLREILNEKFDISELRDLCFDLNVDYENLQGASKADKARELVAYLNCRDRVPDLIEVGKRQRPDIEWDELVRISAQIEQLLAAAPERLSRSFDALITDKIQGFVGRQFVFDALDGFLHTHQSGYFIIRGVCGIGKSALLAKLVHERGYIHHFNIASQNIRSARAFLENFCLQIISRYSLKYEKIPDRALRDSGFLTDCISEAAAHPENHPIVLVIDALDEVDRRGLAPAVNILYLPPSLPGGVYIVASTRPLDDIRLRVARQQVLDLEADSEGHLRDISEYIEGYTRREAMRDRLSGWGVSTEQFIASLSKKSEGNFMYLHYVLPAIERGEFVKGTLDELPEGLIAYYPSFAQNRGVLQTR